MPTPLAAERLLEFTNSPTRDHREAVANLLSLSKNSKNQPKLDDLGAPSFAFFAMGGRPRTSTRPLFLGLLALTLLTGCKPVGPNYNRPPYETPPAYKETGASAVIPPPAPAGGAWQPASPSDGLLRGKWWEIYSGSAAQPARRAHRSQQPDPAPGAGNLSRRPRPDRRSSRRALSNALGGAFHLARPHLAERAATSPPENPPPIPTW